ncbi:MAG: hypothetical protein MK086_13955 [Flavobacteriales bacterium]|nr:hypothetical protein [Flavobacteriales bacterium]
MLTDPPKISLLAALVISSSALTGQSLRIPFCIRDIFGLSDEQGKIIVQADEDEITFIDRSFQYFPHTNVV